MNKAEHKEDKQPVVAEGGLQVKAPMPGKITFITAKVGEPVNKGAKHREKKGKLSWSSIPDYGSRIRCS